MIKEEWKSLLQETASAPEEASKVHRLNELSRVSQVGKLLPPTYRLSTNPSSQFH
ncbi:hypothetical protein ACLOJK_017585 [Asimina triloba]